MKFSAALYAAAFVTCAMASPITEPRTTDAAADDELIVTIKDYEFTEDSKLVPRLNTQSANNVGYGKAIAAAVDAAYTQAKQIANWDKVCPYSESQILVSKYILITLTVSRGLYQGHDAVYGPEEPRLEQSQGSRLLQPRLQDSRSVQLLRTAECLDLKGRPED